MAKTTKSKKKKAVKAGPDIGKEPKKKKTAHDDDSWDEEWDDADEEIIEDDDGDEGVPASKGFTKIKDLKEGMNDVNVEATVDFVGQIYGKEYGEKPYAISFIRDDTGEVKITFWGDDIKKAKKGRKIKVMHACVTAYKGQIQMTPNRQRGVDFL